MVRVRSYRRKDGTKVSAHNRSAPAAAAAVAVSVSVAIAVGGAPGGTASIDVQKPSARTSAKQTQAKNRAKADFNRITLRLRQSGYHVSAHVAEDLDCEAHSYGQVHSFFRSSPCDLLSRVSLELKDKFDNVVLVAVSRVDMPEGSSAIKFKRLVDASGTGNVTELSREVGSYQDVRYTGQNYTSSISGSSVRNTQIQPAGWQPTNPVLQRIRDQIK